MKRYLEIENTEVGNEIDKALSTSLRFLSKSRESVKRISTSNEKTYFMEKLNLKTLLGISLNSILFERWRPFYDQVVLKYIELFILLSFILQMIRCGLQSK